MTSAPTVPSLHFLVFAAPKSGTTWMQTMLSAHPRLHCGETRPFGPTFNPANPSSPYITLEAFATILQRYLNPPLDDPQFADALLAALYEAVARTARDRKCALSGHDEVFYGEKLTPPYGAAEAVVDRLIRHCPRLRLIHLVRDGRDMLVSGYAHTARLRLQGLPDEQRKRGEEAIGRHELPEAEIASVAPNWAAIVRAGLRAETCFPDSLRLRYEDLLADTPARLAEVFTFLGVESDPAIVDACVEAGSFRRLSGGREPGQEDASSFFRKGVAGDWKTWMTPEAEAAFERLAGAEMRALGYIGR